jgi:MoxR-like ATPase
MHNPFENDSAEQVNTSLLKIKAEIQKIIIGQDELINLLLAGLLAKGHVLIEGVPGIAKTITAKLFARTLSIPFSRIQFTPDLMPSDVLGSSVLNMNAGTFEFKKGPVFSSLILIDEINRAPAKTQSALFEVMEERQVTIDGKTYPMEEPFMVLATQNPIEQEGTYRLPEAQLDRFLFKIKLGYPSLESEIEIIKSHHERKNMSPLEEISAILDARVVKELQQKRADVMLDEKIMQYIASIVVKTRNHPQIYLGASPRASLAIMQAAQAFAVLEGRDFVIPEDVKHALLPVLNHRIILHPESEMEGLTSETVISNIVSGIEIPR